MRFEGKAGIVTGGGSGLGREVARLIVEQAGSVMIVDRDEQAGARVAAELAAGGGDCGGGNDGDSGDGGEVIFHAADVTDEAQVAAAIERCRDQLGGLHFIHNNAGVQLEKPLHETTEAEWDWVNEVNLKGVFFGCKHAIIAMMGDGGGSILNTASILAHSGDPFLPAYTATKTGVLGLTRAIAVGYAEHGIRANCVSPGDMETPMLQRYFDATPDADAARAEMAASYPGKRLATPREVAQAAVFLLSEEASFVSGEFILADAGLLAKTY